jgi:2-polyprenyl-3-methyl-5-hydroxy-6-metoxy-1,4-benzoquinol methylase
MSKTVYDNYYKDEKYFGSPYTGLINFFEQYSPKGTVLDLGCGQGRDSIPIAKMGYNVIAVDHSVVGINQLKNEALLCGVKLDAFVGDIYNMDIDENIDIVLLDSMLHFYKKDILKESEFVIKVLEQLKVDGLFVNFILKGENREKILKEIITKLRYDWEILIDKYVDYPESSAKFHMLVIRKVNTL